MLGYLAVLLIVGVWLWLGRRRSWRAFPPARNVPARAEEFVPATTVLAPIVIAPPASAPATLAPARAPTAPVTGYMLRRRGLCSPDPHHQE